MIIAYPTILMMEWERKRWEADLYRRLLEGLDQAEYASPEEKQVVRKHVKDAWKRINKDKPLPSSPFLTPLM